MLNEKLTLIYKTSMIWVMIARIVGWIKTHKLVVVLLLVVVYFLFPKVNLLPVALDMRSSGIQNDASERMVSGFMPIVPQVDYAPTPEVKNRLVVQNSYLSLLVKDVVSVRKEILDYAAASGGYMVSAETSNPQDAPTATITVRVPSEKLDTALEMFRGWGIKVVSENLVGTDVTDQYVDIDARVVTLEKTKASMEAILVRAEQISDLANITQQIINIQSQIDALRGAQKSLSENAKLAKVTVYLSTDEIALPYAPSETFRPGVIFKLAVRSLTTNLRQLASVAIWAGVYSVIWVPVVLTIYLLNGRFRKKV